MNEHVAITGANGYVGGLIRAASIAAGFDVISLQRRPSEAGEWRAFDLARRPSDSLLDGVDVLVHAAWDLSGRGVRQESVNTSGSRHLFDLARENSIRTIFISSMSAFDGTRQRYGLAKLDAERELLRSSRNLSVRPGLVWGTDAGGMVGLLRHLGTLPLVPCPVPQPHQFAVHATDLTAAILCAIADPSLYGTVGAAHPARVPFRCVVDELAERGDVTFLPFPPGPGIAVLRAAERLRVPLPFRADSLMGLVESAPTVPNVHQWTTRGIKFRSLQTPRDAHQR